jgi:DNA-binding XRE family transcriptional regulator
MEITQLRLIRMEKVKGGARKLAQGIGMNSGHLCAVERGDQRCPIKWQIAISEALGVSIERLFNERGMALSIPSVEDCAS